MSKQKSDKNNTADKKNTKDAIKALKQKMVDIWEDAFHVRYKDGGLELIVEVENSEEKTGLWDYFKEMKFMGYHITILKVPPGNIEVFYKE